MSGDSVIITGEWPIRILRTPHHALGRHRRFHFGYFGNRDGGVLDIDRSLNLPIRFWLR
jgi:hypothetical protein